MRYFVTGGTGFLGREVVRQLVDRGDEVVALARSPKKADRLPSPVDVVEGDITDKASMRDQMDDVDGVFHIAGWYKVGVDDRKTAEDVNVLGTRNVLELMEELGITRGVYTSTLAVFSDTDGVIPDESYQHEGPHLSLYDRTKHEAHYAVAEPMIDDGLPLIIVQPGAIYGPDDRGPTWLLWEAYLRGRLAMIPRATGYCWSHVEDTALAHLQAMDRGIPGETYIIAGEPRTLVEVFDLVADIVGRSPPRSVPPVIFRALSWLVRPIEAVTSLPPQYTSEALRV
ncbi:MAG: NAD-dependent epimerase/dehydratase family protein, partial [Halobacteriota archaeon]